MNITHPYRHASGWIGVMVQTSEFETFPESISIDGKSLVKKKEFHMSILHEEAASRALTERGMSRENAETEVLAFVGEFVGQNPITLGSYISDFRHAIEGEKESVLIRCSAVNIEEFFATLNQKFGLSMQLQPTHVTLYTLPGLPGVGISSEALMNTFAEVHIAELEQAAADLFG